MKKKKKKKKKGGKSLVASSFICWGINQLSPSISLKLNWRKEEEEESMAATLSFLQLPLLPPRNQLHISSKLSIYPISAHFSDDSSFSSASSNPQKLLKETILHLKSASLPLAAITLPIFLDPKACYILFTFFNNIILNNDNSRASW